MPHIIYPWIGFIFYANEQSQWTVSIYFSTVLLFSNVRDIIFSNKMVLSRKGTLVQFFASKFVLKWTKVPNYFLNKQI